MSDEKTEQRAPKEGENDSERFEKLPQTTADQTNEGRATRAEILDWWADRFGIDQAVFADYTFWEKGAGKIWILAGDSTDRLRIEALGMRIMHTRQEHWKPTTNAVQRFGVTASKGVIQLDDEAARRFVSGETQEIEWDGDWGYVIAAREITGSWEPLGVGLYTYGELKSQIPKGRRRELP